jgi:hypothetical protein
MHTWSSDVRWKSYNIYILYIISIIYYICYIRRTPTWSSDVRWKLAPSTVMVVMPDVGPETGNTFDTVILSW